MPSSGADPKSNRVWEEIPRGLTASDVDFLSNFLQSKYSYSEDRPPQFPSEDRNTRPDGVGTHAEFIEKLLPKSFDPLLQKKIMLENELIRLDSRGETLKGALRLIDKYENELNNIEALRNPKVQVREGKEDLELSLRLFNDYEFIENVLTRHTVQHPKYLECLGNCKKYIKVLEIRANWKEAKAYRNKYSTLIAPSTEKIKTFILKHFEDASKLELIMSRGNVKKCLEGVCDRNKLLADQLAPFCQVLVDCDVRECAEAYISYRIDTLRLLLSCIPLDHLPLIENLFLGEQAAVEALCFGSQSLKTLLEWMGNQLYTALKVNPDKEVFKRVLLVYEGTSLPYRTLLELLCQ